VPREAQGLEAVSAVRAAAARTVETGPVAAVATNAADSGTITAPAERQAHWQALTADACPAGRGGRLIMRTVLRNLYPLNTKMGWSIIFLPIIVVYGVLMASPNLDLGFAMLVWMWTFFTLLTIPPLSTLHRIDPLPISRRQILPFLILPGLLVGSLSYGIARGIGSAEERRDGLVTCRMLRHPSGGGSYCGVLVPGRYLEITSSGEIPAYEAPWGESQVPWHAPLVTGGSVHLYTEFGTPPHSSAEYIAHQLSRAIERIYGAHIAAAELRERYLVERPDGTTAIREGGVTMVQDYPGLTSPPPAGIVPLGIALMGVPWLLIIAIILRPLARVSREASSPWLSPLISGVPMVIFIVYIAAAIKGAIEPWVVNAFVEILARRAAEAAPGGIATLWGATLLLLAGGCLLAARGFRRVEAPVEASGG